MTKDVAELLANIHNTLMGAETKGLASMAVVDSVRALYQLVSNPDYVMDDPEEADSDDTSVQE